MLGCGCWDGIAAGSACWNKGVWYYVGLWMVGIKLGR